MSLCWLAPTIRLVRWSSLLVPVATAVAISGVLRQVGQSVPDTMALFIAAALAAAAAASLDDPAHELLSAMPTTSRRRVLHRLAIVVPAVAASWVLAVLAMFRSEGGWNLPALGALVALGVAVTCIAARTRPDAAAAIGVAAPLAAAAAPWLLSRGDPLGSITQVWLEYPGPTITVAVGAAMVATRRIPPSRSAMWRDTSPIRGPSSRSAVRCVRVFPAGLPRT